MSNHEHSSEFIKISKEKDISMENNIAEEDENEDVMSLEIIRGESRMD